MRLAASFATVLTHLPTRSLSRRLFALLVIGGNAAAFGAEPPAPAEPDAPVKTAAKDEPVKMEKVVVQEKAGAETNFSTKATTEALTEVVSGASLAIKVPAAQSSSDLMKDVSGVAVQKGGDGTSKVSVRGLDQRLLRITVDGQRQGGTGNALDNIPPEIVQSLEVTKAFTPDMEADAVGGVINVNTGGVVAKQSSVSGRHQLSYNTLEPRPGTRNSLTVVEPFRFFSAAERNASLLATASFDDQYKLRERLSDLREWPAQVSPGPAPFTGQLIPALTLPLIESTLEHRQRTALVLNVDAHLGVTALFWRANAGRDWAQRNREINDTNPAAGTVLALTPTSGTFAGVPQSRRDQRQTTQRDAANFSGGAKTEIGRVAADATFGYALTHEAEPHTRETVFLSDHTYRTSYDFSGDAFAPAYTLLDETNPADTTSVSDPAHYRFNYLTITRSDTRDEEASAKFNVKISPADAARVGDYVKFGGKLQQRHRTANIDRDVFDAGVQPPTMLGLVGASEVTLKTTSDHFGPAPDADAVAALVSATPGAFTPDTTQTAINSSSGDYTVTETVGAFYGMGKMKLGRWTLLGGARVEATRTTGKGNQMNFSPAGNFLGFTPARGAQSYVEALPSFHLRYDPSASWIYRGSITRSLSRPNYADVAPFRTISFVDHRSRAGNPHLQPYQATNFDFSVDHYSDRRGLFSLSLFYKKIDHFIADRQDPVTIGSLGTFIEFNRVNGDSALAMGVEANWQSPNWDLPHALGTGSLVVNYSYTHGEAHYPTRPGETFPLPDQANYQGSITAHLERGPLSLEGSIRYRSLWWEDLIGPGLDNYLEGAWDAELSATYKLGKNTRLTLGATNLLDVPQRHYAGTHAHMNDFSRSGVDCTLGVQWKM
jgi:TonB-dependent receptor